MTARRISRKVQQRPSAIGTSGLVGSGWGWGWGWGSGSGSGRMVVVEAWSLEISSSLSLLAPAVVRLRARSAASGCPLRVRVLARTGSGREADGVSCPRAELSRVPARVSRSGAGGARLRLRTWATGLWAVTGSDCIETRSGRRFHSPSLVNIKKQLPNLSQSDLQFKSERIVVDAEKSLLPADGIELSR